MPNPQVLLDLDHCATDLDVDSERSGWRFEAHLRIYEIQRSGEQQRSEVGLHLCLSARSIPSGQTLNQLLDRRTHWSVCSPSCR
jgi:hypothetical protein